MNTTDENVLKIAESAKLASCELAMLSAEQRSRAVMYAAAAIEAAEMEICQANQADVHDAVALVKENNLSQSLLSRLFLDSHKLRQIADGMRQVAELPDPLGQITYARALDKNLELFRVTCPIGAIAVIFESRPDALPQIASLCLKSGNAVILKGGREALRTNQALFRCIQQGAGKAGVPSEAVAFLDSREAVESLLKADQFVDLVIPRGSNQLVRHIQSNTQIPVLGHADGLCHVYIDQFADREKSVKVAVDSKVQYPAACNSVETLLVHKEVAGAFLPEVIQALKEHCVEVRCHQDVLSILPENAKEAVSLADASDWSTEYCDLIVSIKTVESLDEAIRHINKHGSHHTDCIITEDKAAAEKFFRQVNSAGVYCNASTRFADGFRYGFGAEVGISTGAMHPRGPVGLEGLITYKYQLSGQGHIVADYVGEGAKQFTHKVLDCDSSLKQKGIE